MSIGMRNINVVVNIVDISVFNALSIGSSPGAAVLLCIKRGVNEVDLEKTSTLNSKSLSISDEGAIT